MATKTKVKKRLSKPEKVTNEELNQIQNLVSISNKFQIDLGGMELQKHELLHQVFLIKDNINLFREEMKKTYGTDDIDIKNGVINYNKDEQTNKKD